MYYLEKCKYPGCTRTGSVAEKENDNYCKLHKYLKKPKTGEVEENKTDEKTE